MATRQTKLHNPGNPGAFAPTRLTVARQAAGITMKSLAEHVGVSAAAISQYENYASEPRDGTVEDMAYHLQFPKGFFFATELEIVPPESLTFRSRRSMTASMREKASAYSTLAADLVSPAIRQRFHLPAADVPDLSEHSPDEAAALLRTHWKIGLGPIGNTVHLLESRGIDVYWMNEASPSLFGFSRWHGKQPCCFLNHHPSGERGRFDAMHELGHLVLHSHITDLVNKTNGRDIEVEANRFASAFLMPPDQFLSESPRYPVLDTYFPLKRRWGVSIAAMVRRSRDVGAISQWQYEVACKEFSMQRWRIDEPHTLPREMSATHDFVVRKLLDKGITPEDFARSIDLTLRHVEVLMPCITVFNKRLQFGEDAYNLASLRIVDSSIRSGNLGLGTDDDLDIRVGRESP